MLKLFTYLLTSATPDNPRYHLSTPRQYYHECGSTTTVISRFIHLTRSLKKRGEFILIIFRHSLSFIIVLIICGTAASSALRWMLCPFSNNFNVFCLSVSLKVVIISLYVYLIREYRLACTKSQEVKLTASV